MPPIVPLMGCAIFVAVLLKTTTRSREERSRALWVPTVWMLIASSRPVGRWFDPVSVSIGESSPAASSLPDQAVMGVLILLALAIAARRNILWREVMRNNRWAFAVVVYAGLSILWSGYAGVSAKRWVRLVGIVSCALVVMSEQAPLKAIEVVLRRTAYVLVPFSVVLVKYFPAYGVEYSRWGGRRMAIGVCMQKNGLGLLCAVSAFFLIWDFVRRRRAKALKGDRVRTTADGLVLLLTLYLLKGADTDSYSATSIGVLAIGLVLFVALSVLRAYPKYLVLSVAVGATTGALLLAAASLLLGWSPVSWWAVTLGRNETLTGRVDIWDQVFQLAPRWSLFGKGFGGFWGLAYTWVPIGQMTGHNGYLDVYVELGFVGVGLLVAFLGSLMPRLKALATEDFDWARLGICLLVISVAYNYTESDYMSVTSLLWTTLVFVSFCLPGDSGGTDRSVERLGRTREGPALKRFAGDSQGGC